MKNINLPFSTIEELESFINDNSIKDTKQLLIQLFCGDTDLQFIKSVQKYIQEKLPSCVLIGTTTDGVIDSSRVYYKSKSVASFSIFESTKLQAKLIKYSECEHCVYEAGKLLASSVQDKDLKALICFADGINTNGEDFVKGIEEVVPNAVLAGGLSGDNGELKKTYVFDNYEIINSGAVGVGLINPTLNVATSYLFDWKPIGKKMRVTKAVNNRVYELDGLPIVDVYAKYMGQELANKLPQIGIEFPLVFEKEGMSLGRAPLAKHDDGSLTFAGNIDEYDMVSFGVGDIDAILNNGTYAIHSFANQNLCQSEAVFIYSCMARRRFLENYIRHELETLSQLGNSSGFFTYGEFFHFQDKNQLLNETMTFITLSETCQKIDHHVILKDESFNRSEIITTQHVLANLANTVSNELADLNEHLEQRVRENSAYIFQQAYINQLTGLPNRISLINALEKHIGKVLLLINVDDFTTINDFYGYQVGDEVLKKIGEVLQHFAHEHNSRAYKLPSDEFAMILDVKNHKTIIEKNIKQLISEIESKEYFFNEHHIHIGVTIAGAIINTNKTGLVNADMTLKLAKNKGKNFMLFNEDLKLAQQYEYNVKMASLIKNALADGNVIPYFQPIIDVHTLEIRKYEALVRLKKPDGSILLPCQFLDISRKIRLYEKITLTMIEQTFSFFSKNELKFSINLDFSDIANAKIKKFLFEKIKEYDIAQQLTIEILETQEFQDVQTVLDFVDEVYAHNAKIAIDDFGSGYANFEYITNIRSDFMKIDGSLIKNIDKDRNARIITETIIGFAKKLNKKIVAEFVHSKEVFDVVKELGVDYVQGYYLGVPKESI
ncbi:bifunctional diguanylate cyclase/phosphodiesterase [Sulfurimonas marina]|uniref:EAL domain-containing protein n=1 Tax=Sulfurimonas marina TaxID=2590551 RepID=A0A7M1AVN3_9BACT|nr:EAL domain-containing protein [Sulfurimonas marina]QOP40648.1 EAL domain-containing protein [Sulfurimonas marina]